MNTRPRRLLSARIAGMCLAFGLTSVALADDVTDQIDEALKAYQKKDLGTAQGQRMKSRVGIAPSLSATRP